MLRPHRRCRQADRRGRARSSRDKGVDLLVVADPTSAKIGGDGAGSDGVDADLPRAEFERHEPGQRLERCHGRGIEPEAGHRSASKARRDVEDASAIGDDRQQCLRQEHRSAQVHVDHRIELFFACVSDRHVDDRTGVVDQIVESIGAEAASARWTCR